MAKQYITICDDHAEIDILNLSNTSTLSEISSTNISDFQSTSEIIEGLHTIFPNLSGKRVVFETLLSD